MDSNFAVVVTWNGEDYIAKCLQSLLLSEATVQVVVVDNASTDQTLKIVHRLCPEAVVFPLRHNLGFGKANNIGIKYAYEQGADHVLLLNQDAFVEPNVIGNLADFQRLNSEFGILSPLHLDGSGCCLDRLFSSHLSKAPSMRHMLSDLLLDGCMADVYDAGFINAAAWFLSRECVERVGLFNPAFEHYGEDKEYADRVYFQGLRIGFMPNLHVFHDRIQNRPTKEVTVERYLLEEKAIIRYRLSRKIPSTAINLLSALSRVMLSSPPGNVSHLDKMRSKAILLRELFSCLPTMLRMKRIAYQGNHHCFFAETDLDKELISNTKGSLRNANTIKTS